MGKLVKDLSVHNQATDSETSFDLHILSIKNNKILYHIIFRKMVRNNA